MKTTKILGTVLAVFLLTAFFISSGAAAPAAGSTVYVYQYGATGDVAPTTYYHYENGMMTGAVTTDVTGTFTGEDITEGIYDSMPAGLTAGSFILKYPAVTLDAHKSGTGTSINGTTVFRTQLVDFIISGTNGLTYGVKFTSPEGGTTYAFGKDFVTGLDLTFADSTVFPASQLTNVGISNAATGEWKATANLKLGNVHGKMTITTPSKYVSSNTVTFTIGLPPAESISSNKETITRGGSVLITITGDPGTVIPVTIDALGFIPLAGQPGISAQVFDPVTGYLTSFTATLSSSGTRTLQFDTDSLSEDATYRFTAVFPVSLVTKKADVTVEKGSVSVQASQDTYYIGEEITLSGVNTESNVVYLYIKGANVATTGIPGYSGFIPVPVESDDTWTATFNTRASLGALDAGTYTIYAAASAGPAPVFAFDSNAVYASTSITLKQPFLTAAVVSSPVEKGYKIKITGNAKATPQILYYIFGTNHFSFGTISVKDDGSYSKEIGTDNLEAGQYFVVIQHPMNDGYFNVGPIASPFGFDIVQNPIGSYNGIDSTILFNTNERQSSNAAEALCAALDSQNIDDIYVKLTFVVTSPQLTVDPVSDVARGSPLTISGTSTFQAGTVVSVELVSAASSGTLITQNTVAVTESDGANIWNVTIDTSNIDEGLYIFRASAEGESASSLVLIFETPEETLSVPSVLTPGLTLKSLTVTPDYSPGVTEGTPVSVTAVLWLSRDVVSSQGLLKLTTDLSDTPVWNIDVYKGNVVNNQINGDILITTLNSTDFGTTISGFALDYDLPVTLVINLTGKVSSLDSNTAAVRIGGDLDGYGNAFTSSYLYGPKYVPVVSVDEVPLQSGWNFISVPKTLNTTIQSAKNLFVEVDTDNRSILGYDAFQKVWVSVESADPVQPLNAYWIYAKTPCSVDLAYPDTPALPAAKTLYPGWNAVGLSSLNNTPAQTALFGTSWRVLIPWNLEGGMFDQAIVNGGSDANSPSRLMTPGNGYWVYVDSESTLIGLTA